MHGLIVVLLVLGSGGKTTKPNIAGENITTGDRAYIVYIHVFVCITTINHGGFLCLCDVWSVLLREDNTSTNVRPCTIARPPSALQPGGKIFLSTGEK